MILFSNNSFPCLEIESVSKFVSVIFLGPKKLDSFVSEYFIILKYRDCRQIFLVGEGKSLRKSVVKQEIKSNLYLKLYYLSKNYIHKIYYFKILYITNLKSQKTH